MPGDKKFARVTIIVEYPDRTKEECKVYLSEDKIERLRSTGVKSGSLARWCGAVIYTNATT